MHPDKPEEACGVYAVLAPGQPVANLTYFGLYALQHRGQESAGIAVFDADHKAEGGAGLLKEVHTLEVAIEDTKGAFEVVAGRFNVPHATALFGNFKGAVVGPFGHQRDLALIQPQEPCQLIEAVEAAKDGLLLLVFVECLFFQREMGLDEGMWVLDPAISFRCAPGYCSGGKRAPIFFSIWAFRHSILISR